MKLRFKQGNVTPEMLRERLRLARAYLQMTEVFHAMAFPEQASLNIEALLVMACIFIDEADGLLTTATRIEKHSRLSHATTYRRLEELLAAGKIVKSRRYYYLAENAITDDKARKLQRIVDTLCGN